MTKCTITVTATGGKCGAPAVLTFTGRDGELLGECEKHVMPTSAPAPAAPVAKRGHLVMPVTGSKLRTERSTRFVLVAEFVIGSPRVVKGSSNIDVLRKARTSSSMVIFDLVSGEVVR